MHIAFASPISGHLVAWSNQFPNCLIGSKDTSWLSSKHWIKQTHVGCKHSFDPICTSKPTAKSDIRNIKIYPSTTRHWFCFLLYTLRSDIVAAVKGNSHLRLLCISSSCYSGPWLYGHSLIYGLNSLQMLPNWNQLDLYQLDRRASGNLLWVCASCLSCRWRSYAHTPPNGKYYVKLHKTPCNS